jgi:DNA-binding transcriptional ArsR family regulator
LGDRTVGGLISFISEMPKEARTLVGTGLEQSGLDDGRLDQCKALANETRLRVLEWLKDPAVSFPACGTEAAELGVCVGLLQQKAGTSASTMSVHLAILQRAGFVVATRRGQWTYYRRDEARIRAFCERLHHDL